MNKNFVLPKVYFIGATAIRKDALITYLEETDQIEFINEVRIAEEEGLSDGEILCSFYAKLCYAALTDKKNKNISKVRSIHNNVLGTIDSKHGSVFEHCSLNFVVTNCSRVFTHEMVRHRVGTAFSQTSGRYVRNNELNVVIDPILAPVYEEAERIRNMIEQGYKIMEAKMFEGVTDFDKKKKITSALRRFMPNGQANEIGVTLNLRTLRHTIEQRTSRHAEWEIRVIFNQIAELVKDKYPAIFEDANFYPNVSGQEVILKEITFKNQKI